MSRSSKKGPYFDEKLLKKVLKVKESGKKDEPIKTWSRSCTILPDFVDHVIMVHNGKNFIKVAIREEMVGHKLGEFAMTRTFRGHVNKGKKK